jgi:hypothetical protein
VNKRHRHLLVAAAAAAAVSLVLPTSGAVAQSSGARAAGTTLFGLTTGNRIVTLNTAFPVFATNDVAISGLAPGEQLIGIDRRPRTGVVYGVGRQGTTGRLYTVDPATGVATFVATLVAAPTAASPRGGPIALSGNEFGFDFNPMADALRIVSDTGQNLRLIPSDRTPATGPALLAGDTFADGTLNADVTPATGVSAAAYTNNVAGATATVLYDLDTRRDVLVQQTPPNAGTLVTVGRLRFPAGSVAGFDIVTADGVDAGYAALTVAGLPYTLLAEVNLSSGQAEIAGIAAFPRTLRGLTA